MKKIMFRDAAGFALRQFLLVLTLLLLLPAANVQAARPRIQAACVEFESRLPTLKRQLPALIRSAEKSAYQMLAHPEARLNVPYYEQMGFSEEMMGRAGGLACAAPGGDWARNATPYDVVLLSVRSWEVQRDLMQRRVAEFKSNGWLVTVIGSAQGKPADLGEDFFIDNGAPDASAKQGRINALANVALGWMWCCEYASALSRKGWFPGILYSVGMTDMTEFNQSLARPGKRPCLLPCQVSIAAGDLAKRYHRRLEKMMRDVKSSRIQKQVADATEIIAQRMAEGRTVALAGMGHIILAEVKCDNRAPWLGFRAVSQLEIAFRTHLKPGDLLVWMTYCGMNSRWDDYAQQIADTGADLITCYAPDPVWSSNAPPTLAHIDQSWMMPDAEVPIPVLPKAMAPISGINVTLLARMLDDAVADRLTVLGGQPRQHTSNDLPAEFLHYAGMRQWFGQAGARPELWQGTWQIISTNGNPVFDRSFEAVRRLKDGCMAARDQGRWGFVDEAGNWVVKPVYIDVADFRDGQARVRTEHGAGIIDALGKPVIPFLYNQLGDSGDGRWWRLAPSDRLFAETNGLWGVIDRQTGTNILPLTYTALLRYADDRLMFQTDNRWGLMDNMGRIIAPATFETIFPLAGFAAKIIKNGKYGGIDNDGNIVIKPVFDFISSIASNEVYALKDGHFGAMTHAGEALAPVVQTRYKKTQSFGKNLQLALDNSRWGVINENGETLVPFAYSDLARFGDDQLRAKQAGRWGVIDATNHVIIPVSYETLSSVSSNTVLAQRDGAWTLIDLATGNETALMGYDFYAPLGNDRFKVVKDGKWGVIASSGEIIIPLEYSFIYGTWNDWLFVAKGGQWDRDPGLTPRLVGRRVGLIDWQNQVVIPCKYEAINPYGFGKDRLAVATTIEDLPLQP